MIPAIVITMLGYGMLKEDDSLQLQNSNETCKKVSFWESDRTLL